MAGESPDRSKQRESSAEPTSGSAGPVPEARGEARDPRLAVAREAEPTSSRGGGVDTATRVFSARDVAKARAAAEASRPGDDEVTPAGAEGGENDTAADAGSTQDAATTADAETPTAPEEPTPTDTEATEDAAAPEKEPADATDGSEAAEDAEAPEAADETAPGGAEGAGEAAAADAGGSEDAEGPEDAVADAEGAKASGAAEGTAPTGGAAAAGTGLAETAGATDGTEGPRDAGEPEDADDAAATGGGAAEGAAVVEGSQGAEVADDAEEPAGAEGDGTGDARLRAAVAAWVRSGDAADSGAEDAADEAGERPESAEKADAAPEAPEELGEAEEGDSPAADSDSVAEADAERAPGAAAKAAVPSWAAKATPAPQAADGEDAPQGPPAADDKADGEAGAHVDQPTTMLKLPSKFVALKPDVTTPVPQVGPERTTQQPLPPKPPLDLLAELTNTPRPPETPLRTTVRRVKIWTPLVLLLAVVFAIVQNVRTLPTPTLELTAEDSYSFDGSKIDIPWPAEGQAALDVQGIGSFGSSGDQKPVPIASVAKVMTAYVILRDHPLKSGAEGPKITIDQTAEDQSQAGQESTVNVTAGDSITQREALESILIASANNVARLLARWDAGSEKAFVEKMNAAAEDLGMTNTTYTDPSGLNDTTVSTAVDQVKLGKKAMEEPAFREVAAMMSYDDYKGVNHSNWNQIVGKNNVVGIKTGTTTSALGNLLFAAKKEVNGETRTIVGAVVRQPAGGVDNTILSAALTAGDELIRAAQGALESATIIKKGAVVGYVDDGLGGRTAVVATKDVTAVGWSGLTVKLTFAADDVPHTAKAGTKVGTLTVGDASAGAVAVPVALQNDLVEPGFTDKLTRIT